MAVKKVTKNGLAISVSDPADNVLLTVTIGNAQIGGNVVRWKDSDVIIGKGEIKNLNLGTGMKLSGRTLLVTTNVLDVNPVTNGIVINHYFHNCRPSLFPYSDSVDNDGDIYQLKTEYTFS